MMAAVMAVISAGLWAVSTAALWVVWKVVLWVASMGIELAVTMVGSRAAVKVGWKELTMAAPMAGKKVDQMVAMPAASTAGNSAAR